MSGILKRKFEEVEAASPCSSPRESDGDVSSSESGDSADSVNPSASGHFTPASILKREKRMRTRSVHFEKVTVYYFSRRQGFTSVPSQGGSTLGMSSRHCGVRHYTLGEFAREQERTHRDMLRDHLKEEKLNSIKLQLTKNGTVESDEATVLTAEDISDDDIDLDNTEVDEYFFLQPLTTKKRRALLRASGVKKIDVEEKHELRSIRVSREDCGCDCRVFCDPETCACSAANIKCQVDRMSFPCGCTKEGCSNTAGRIEFNPIRVRTHFLHTIMKLELEKSREQQQVSIANSYHGESNVHSNALVQAQCGLEYSLAEAVPQSAMMHLQTADEMDGPIEEEDEEEEEEEEEEEDDEDEEEEDEEEEEDNEEEGDEEDASSLCSGLSDSSTQSLAASDSEEEDDDEEDKSDDFKDGAMAPAASHGEGVTLSSVLCYSDSAMLQDSRNGGSCYFGSNSADFYQLESSSSVSTITEAEPSGRPYSEACPFQDGVANTAGTTPLGAFGATSEQYQDFGRASEGQYGGRHFGLPGSGSSVIVCGPDQENNMPSGSVYRERQGGRTHMDFQNYLNNNSQEGYINNGHCFISEKMEGSSALNDIASLQDSRQSPPQATSV